MKTKAIFSLSAILLGMGALPSFAGEAFVSNSHSWQNIFNGYGRSDTSFHESYNGYRLGIATAAKYEQGYNSSEPVYSIQPVKYDSSSNKDSISTDPSSYKGYTYVAGSASLNAEFGKFKQTTNTTAYQHYNFTGGSDSHSVSSGFRY